MWYGIGFLGVVLFAYAAYTDGEFQRVTLNDVLVYIGVVLVGIVFGVFTLIVALYLLSEMPKRDSKVLWDKTKK